MPLQHIEVLRNGAQDKEKVTLVAPHSAPPWTADAMLTVVGRHQPRVERAEKVTGRARYRYDVRLPGQLYARLLRSPHPHARILQVDTTKAAALPGVHAVLSVLDTPEIEAIDRKIWAFALVNAG